MEREDDQRIGEQIDDEPQVLPRRHDDALERAEAEVIGAPEGREGLRISMVVHQIDPHLGRNDDDHREDGRDQQACAARPQEGEPFAAGKQGRGGISRHHEQQRQPPAVQRQHGQPRELADLAPLHMPAPGYESHADMVEDQKREGRDAQPVHAEMAAGCRVGQRVCVHAPKIRRSAARSAISTP